MSRASSCSPSAARPGQTAACRARSGRGTAHQQPGHDTRDPDSTGTGNGGMQRSSHDLRRAAARLGRVPPDPGDAEGIPRPNFEEST